MEKVIYKHSLRKLELLTRRRKSSKKPLINEEYNLSLSIDVKFEKECKVLHALNPGVKSVIVIESSGLLVLKWSSQDVDTEFTSSYVREFLSLIKMTTNHYGIGDPIGVMLEGKGGFFLVFRSASKNSIVIMIKEETSRSTLRYRLMKDFAVRVEDILDSF